MGLTGGKSPPPSAKKFGWPAEFPGNFGRFPGNPLEILDAPAAFPEKFPGCRFPGNSPGGLDISRDIPREMDFPGNDSREIPRGISREIWLAIREIPRQIWTRPAGFGRLGPFWLVVVPPGGCSGFV